MKYGLVGEPQASYCWDMFGLLGCKHAVLCAERLVGLTSGYARMVNVGFPRCESSKWRVIARGLEVSGCMGASIL